MSNHKPFRISRYISHMVLAPSVLMVIIFVYGFIIFTILLSLTGATLLPSFKTWVGFENYQVIFELTNWQIALKNVGIFSLVYISVSVILGLFIAIILNQHVRGENVFRAIYLYPMSISFIVTGTIWKWILDPGIGIEKFFHNIGLTSFSFSWIKNSDFAIYCVIFAGIWQVTGFIMAMFLAGLRSIPEESIEAANIDGASIVTIYTRVVIPQLGPIFLSTFVILAHMVIKSYDLIIALTNGGPGRATEMPSTFIYSYIFTRSRMGMGATAAVIMFMMIAVIAIPYLRLELNREDR